MDAAQRKSFRPTTVKNNILGSIRAIRGTRKTIETFTGNPVWLEGSIHCLKKDIAKFWAERKANKWTN